MLTTHEVSDYSVTTYEVTPTTFRLHARSGRNQNEVKARSGRDQHEVKARSGRDQNKIMKRGQDEIRTRYAAEVRTRSERYQREVRTRSPRSQEDSKTSGKSTPPPRLRRSHFFFPLHGCQHATKAFLYIYIHLYTIQTLSFPFPRSLAAK